MLFVDRKTTPKLLPSPATAPSRTSSKQMGQRPQNSYKLGHILEWHKESKTCLHMSSLFFILWYSLTLITFDAQTKSIQISWKQTVASPRHRPPSVISQQDPWLCKVCQCLGHDLHWLHRPMTLCWWNWWIFARKMFQISCSRGHMHGETGPLKSDAALPYASLKEEPTR